MMTALRAVPLLLFGLAGRVTAQRADVVPQEARDLVVKVATFRRDTQRRAGTGAGVVFGWNDTLFYIVTAAHTISFRPPGRPLTDPADTLAARVMVIAKDTIGVAARLVVIAPDPALDMAVLSVPRSALGHQWHPIGSVDRLGDVGRLQNGAAVWPLGCPGGDCWEAPAEPDHVMALDTRGILFQSSFVRPGSSGGALFNQWWEVVGMVTEDLTVRANAVPFDLIVAQLKKWQLPVLLTEPAVPRGGYRTTVGVSVLAPSRSPFESERAIPSGRVTFARRPVARLSWHVALLRLAPPNLGVTGGMVGGALHIKAGRLALQPFGEAGFGRVQGRYDIGGYYVAGPNGNQYVPSYRRVAADGLGVGGGLTMEVIVVPRTMVEVIAAFWNFTLPENAPRLDRLFVGAGIRRAL